MKFFILVGILIINSCSNYEKQNQQAKKVGDYLIEISINNSISHKNSTEHFDIVNLGDSLKDKLLKLKPSFNNSCYTQVKSGDSKISDGEASHHIFIVCDKKKKIAIRLKFDNKYKKFHILGYLTNNL